MTALEERQIRALMESLAQAIRDKDIEGVVSHYASDAVIFDLAPPLTQEGSEIAKNLAAWFPTWKGAIGYELRDLRILVGEGVAFSTSLHRIHGERTSGETSDVWVRATYGFRKDDGVWVIENEHLSVPFYMDGSERAATDLKP